MRGALTARGLAWLLDVGTIAKGTACGGPRVKCVSGMSHARSMHKRRPHVGGLYSPRNAGMSTCDFRS